VTAAPADDEAPEPLAILVLRGLDRLAAGSFVNVLALRQQRLEELVVRAVRVPVSAEGAPPAGGGDAVILPGTGSVIVPITQLRREYRQTNDDCWVIANGPVYASALGHWPGHLQQIDLDPACRKGAGVLVGVVDSGNEQGHATADAAVVHTFAKITKWPRVKVLAHAVDFHVGPGTAPLGGWYHGSRVGARIVGVNNGVVPDAALVVAAALTEVGTTESRPEGTIAQVVAALDWLVTEPFRGPDAVLGCDVINASLSMDPTTPDETNGIRQAIALAGAGNTLIVCASGTYASTASGMFGPLAADPSVMTVGGLDPTVSWAPVNLYDAGLQKPELCAPGPSSSYATPLVTGACALLLQQDPTLRAGAAALKARVIHDFSYLPVTNMPATLTRGRLSMKGACHPEDTSTD
jgi:hypothetical protein